MQLDRPECKDKIDKIQQQINWPRFPGVQALLLKGLTNYITAESAWNLLSKLTLSVNALVVNPNHGEGGCIIFEGMWLFDDGCAFFEGVWLSEG